MSDFEKQYETLIAQAGANPGSQHPNLAHARCMVADGRSGGVVHVFGGNNGGY